MITNKSKSELKAERRSKLATMNRIIEGKQNLNERERTAFDNLRAEVKDIDAHLDQMKRSRAYTGDPTPGSRRTADDESFSTYLRGKGSQREYRSVLDANSLSTAPNSAGITAGSTGYDGGYMIPQGFWALLSQAIKVYGGISSSFKLLETPTGAPMPWATTDTTSISGKYLTEMNQLGFGLDSNSTDIQFGQGMLNAWTIVSGVVLASQQLMEDSAFDVDNFVSMKCGEAIGRKLASESVSGSGNAALLGIITALGARGSVGTVGSTIAATGGYVQMGTATDIAVLGNYSSPSQTELVGNLIGPQTAIACLKAVDPAYYPNAKWYMNANTAFNMLTISDGNGRPLLNFLNGFNASDDVRNPDYNSGSPVGQLYGFPVVLDNNLPNLTASTTGGPVFGDLSRAMVLRIVRSDARVDISHPTATGVGDVSANVVRLDERYQDYLTTGFLAYVRADARSNDLRSAVTVRPAGT